MRSKKINLRKGDATPRVHLMSPKKARSENKSKEMNKPIVETRVCGSMGPSSLSVPN